MSQKNCHRDQTTLKLLWVSRKNRAFYPLWNIWYTAYINMSKGQENAEKDDLTKDVLLIIN